MRPSRHAVAIAAVVVVCAARIALTYPLLNDVFDENDHIVCGLERLQRGTYILEPQHPPLVRLAVAAGPYFIGGLRLPDSNFLWSGPWLSQPLEFYWKTLTLARMGNLPFVALLIVVTALWARRLYGDRVGIVAAAIVSCSPAVLGHGGLATLDVAAASTLLLAAYALWRWSETGSTQWAVGAGAACGLALAAKMSALGFLPPIVAAFLLLRWRRGGNSALDPRALAAAALVCGLVVWAAYLGELGPVGRAGAPYRSAFANGESSAAKLVSDTLGSAPVPAPSFWRGVIDVLSHNEQGHRAYLLGEWSERGRLLYFPVVVAVKTTLPLLILAVWALVRRRAPLAVVIPAAAILLVSMASNINIGVRHVLALYPLLAIMAASHFAEADWKGWRDRAALAAVALGVWHACESLTAHPDYVGYFNEIARGREERFLLDSNLDWGQDLAHLSAWMRETRTPAVLLWYFGQAHPEKFGIRVGAVSPDPRALNWFAVSANNLMGMWGETDGLRRLAEREPDAKVGKSIWLYRLPLDEVNALLPRAGR